MSNASSCPSASRSQPPVTPRAPAESDVDGTSTRNLSDEHTDNQISRTPDSVHLQHSDAELMDISCANRWGPRTSVAPVTGSPAAVQQQKPKAVSGGDLLADVGTAQWSARGSPQIEMMMEKASALVITTTLRQVSHQESVGGGATSSTQGHRKRLWVGSGRRTSQHHTTATRRTHPRTALLCHS